MTTTDTKTARFLIVTIDADTGVEEIVRSCWTMNEAMKSLRRARNGAELRFHGETLAHKAGTKVSFTAFRLVSLRLP
jgi:hypothetical protein